MARIAHIVFGFAVALLLAGCSRDTEPQADDSLYWTPLGEVRTYQHTLEVFVDELEKFIRTKERDALLVIHVESDAPFPVLRYALDQARRAGVFKVMIAQK